MITVSVTEVIELGIIPLMTVSLFKMEKKVAQLELTRLNGPRISSRRLARVVHAKDFAVSKRNDYY
jgi:hypothetical protein